MSYSNIFKYICTYTHLSHMYNILYTLKSLKHVLIFLSKSKSGNDVICNKVKKKKCFSIIEG